MGKNPIKALAGQTVVYGFGTIVPRLLNYLLTPLYVRVFMSGEYGQISDLYAWMALMMAILTYGMETTYFRFSQKENANPNKVFSNAESSILITTTLFLIFYFLFYKAFAQLIHYQHNTQYVLFLGIIVALDVISAVPFARLRNENKAKRFSFIKIANVCMNVALNLFFLVLIPDTSLKISAYLFGPQAGLLVWVLISNILSSLLSLLLLLPQIRKMRFEIDWPFFKKMLVYSLPIMMISLVGMVNEVSDKILIKYLVPIPGEDVLASMNMTANEYALSRLGIYSANYKLAVLMTIFIQMFRYASEPFFFSKAKDRNAPELFAKVMNYFVIFCLLIFLGVMLYIDVLKYFAGRGGSDYHEGLVVVPIVLIAIMFYGILFNLSIWFKLTDKTASGTVISIIGMVIMLASLFILVPRVGYVGAAIGHLACNTTMMLVSYFWGQKVYPIPYQVGRNIIYFIVALGIFFLSRLFTNLPLVWRLLINTALILVYCAIAFIGEKTNPLKIKQ